MELDKESWLVEHKGVIPFCFDYKETSCCHSCKFAHCKFYKGKNEPKRNRFL